MLRARCHEAWRGFAVRAIFPTVQLRGRVAQLGERGVRNAEVEGSNPFASTNGFLSDFVSVQPQFDTPSMLPRKLSSPLFLDRW